MMTHDTAESGMPARWSKPSMRFLPLPVGFADLKRFLSSVALASEATSQASSRPPLQPLRVRRSKLFAPSSTSAWAVTSPSAPVRPGEHLARVWGQLHPARGRQDSSQDHFADMLCSLQELQGFDAFFQTLKLLGWKRLLGTQDERL